VRLVDEKEKTKHIRGEGGEMASKSDF